MSADIKKLPLLPMLPRRHRFDMLWRALLCAMLPRSTSSFSAEMSDDTKLSFSRFTGDENSASFINGFSLREGGFSRSCPAFRMLAACVESEKDAARGAPCRISQTSAPRSQSEPSSDPRYECCFFREDVVAGRVSFLRWE